MKKTFVVDTNVLLDDQRAVEAYEKAKVVIPFKVVEELDAHKTAPGQLGGNARAAIRFLDECSKQGDISDGVEVAKSLLVIASWTKAHQTLLERHSLADTPDNRIITTALALKGSVLVSNDLAVRLKAGSLGLTAIPHAKEGKANSASEIYTGLTELEISDESINTLYAKGEIPLPRGAKFSPNQYIHLRSNINSKHTAIGKADKNCIRKVNAVKEIYGVKPKSAEQVCAVDAMTDPNVSLVSLLGRAGTGKSLITLASCLAMIEEGLYQKMILVKSTVVMGDEIGFLPGDMAQKLGPVFESFYDSFDVIFNSESEEKTRGIVQMLIDNGKLEMLPYQFFRGRSMPNVLLVVDEAQNIPADIMKTILTRVAGNSKVILLGDISQIDNKKLDPLYNGLVRVIDVFEDQDCYAHITLNKSERGKLADLASELL